MSVVLMGLNDRVMALPWVCDRSKHAAANLACHTAMLRESGLKQDLCADISGFDRHACMELCEVRNQP